MTAIPQDMQCVTSRDGQILVESRPVPEPGPTELLVRVLSAGLNAADLSQAAGGYPAPPGSPPDILGLELAGEVVSTGAAVTEFRRGDHVMSLVGGGGQAQYAVMDERLAMAVPEALGLIPAGGFPEAYCTAHDALVVQGRLGVGTHLLIHGATGGVGLAATKLALLAGAVVTASVRTEGHGDLIRAMGAEVVSPGTFAQHGPYGLILELIGAANLSQDLAAIAPDGRIVVLGTAAGGDMVELNLREMMRKRCQIFGSTLRGRTLNRRADVVARTIDALLPALRVGRLTVDVHEMYPLQQAPLAYAEFARPGKLGKIILTM